MIARRVARAGIVIVVAIPFVVGLAGCGIPEQGSAKPVDDDGVPYRLLDQNSGGIADSGQLGARDAVIYLARDGRLLPTVRSLRPPMTLTRLVRSLGRGPTRPEVDAGIRTALPVEDTPTNVQVVRGTAMVDLPASFTNLSRADQVLALAQIVYTVTSQPGIGQVQFTLDGASTDIPRANRSLTGEPVSREDYFTLAPPG
ncbi:MAG: GerMN domain-containing protein [Acidimicrobiia bacterium]